jgi:hypothetical protein
MKMTQPNYNIPVPQFSVGGQKMPKWANGLIVVGSIAIVGAVGYYLFVKWREKKKQAESQIILDQVKTELQQELANGQKLSHPKSTYSQNATYIGNLLNGCETINSEMEVANAVMKIVNNKADWLELVNAFGKKDIADCGTFGIAKTNYALPVLLNEQLDTALMFRNASYVTLGFIGGSLDFNFNGVRKTFSGNDDTIDVLRYYLKQKGVTL